MGCSFRWGLRLAVCNHAAGMAAEQSRAEWRTDRGREEARAWHGSGGVAWRGGALKAFTTPDSGRGRENDNARTRFFSNEIFFYTRSSLALFHVQAARSMRGGLTPKIPLSRHIVVRFSSLPTNDPFRFGPENAARNSHRVLIFL